MVDCQAKYHGTADFLQSADYLQNHGMIDLKIFHYSVPEICFLTGQRITYFLKSPLTNNSLKSPSQVCFQIFQKRTGPLKNLLRFWYPRVLLTDSLTLLRLTLLAPILMRSMIHQLKTTLDSRICCGCASACNLETYQILSFKIKIANLHHE